MRSYQLFKFRGIFSFYFFFFFLKMFCKIKVSKYITSIYAGSTPALPPRKRSAQGLGSQLPVIFAFQRALEGTKLQVQKIPFELFNIGVNNLQQQDQSLSSQLSHALYYISNPTTLWKPSIQTVSSPDNSSWGCQRPASKPLDASTHRRPPNTRSRMMRGRENFLLDSLAPTLFRYFLAA